MTIDEQIQSGVIPAEPRTLPEPGESYYGDLRRAGQTHLEAVRAARCQMAEAGLSLRALSRHRTPGRGGSAPMGPRPKTRVNVSLDTDVLERTRERVGPRGLSPEIERLLAAEIEK